MITEDYVSFKTAKLLKEKGFDEPCNHYYYYGKLEHFKDADFYERNSDNTYLDEAEHCMASTHQMAMAWLREKYDLHIIAYPYKADTKRKYCCQVYRTYNLLGYEQYTNETLDSYEEAVEVALKYCLENLI